MDKFVHWDFEKVFEVGLSAPEIGLFFRMAIAVGKDNRCCASVERIAEWVNSSIPWVRKSLKKMEKAGVLVIERSSGGAGRPNVYHICLENNSASDNTGNENNTVASDTPNPVDSDTPNPVEKDAKTLSENRPQKEVYKRNPPKEECVRRVSNTSVSGNTYPYSDSQAVMDTHIHTGDGGFSDDWFEYGNQDCLPGHAGTFTGEKKLPPCNDRAGVGTTGTVITWRGSECGAGGAPSHFREFRGTHHRAP